MSNGVHELAKRLLRTTYEELDEREKRVLKHVAERLHISRDTEEEFRDKSNTLGQRLADKVATFGGSWTFICIFGIVLLLWVVLNTVILARRNAAFDPYPFIFLNLVLSMVAAFQAPVIMMSQNRQSLKDRLDAAHDYEVNLKSELEIMGLHEKIDALRQSQWEELISLQREQITLLKKLVKD